jgi:hypothetical protein
MSKLYLYGIGGVVAVVVLAFVASRIFSAGYDTAASFYKLEIASIKADYAQKAKDELDRQIKESAAAKARESQLIAELDAAEEETTTLQEKLRDEASKDPRADEPVLGAGSMQRLNQIR